MQKMIQLKENRVQSLPARRISAEEFCTLARQSESTVYRPRWEVLRMLAVGEAWGACAADGTLMAAVLLLPIEADTALAAGLRTLKKSLAGREWFLTPPVGAPEYLPPLLKAARGAARHKSPAATVTALLEPGVSGLEEPVLMPYFAAGFSMRGLRPLDSMAPLAILNDQPLRAGKQQVSVPLDDATHLALLLVRGWAAAGIETKEEKSLLLLTQQR